MSTPLMRQGGEGGDAPAGGGPQRDAVEYLRHEEGRVGEGARECHAQRLAAGQDGPRHQPLHHADAGRVGSVPGHGPHAQGLLPVYGGPGAWRVARRVSAAAAARLEESGRGFFFQSFIE